MWVNLIAKGFSGNLWPISCYCYSGCCCVCIQLWLEKKLYSYYHTVIVPMPILYCKIFFEFFFQMWSFNLTWPLSHDIGLNFFFLSDFICPSVMRMWGSTTPSDWMWFSLIRWGARGMEGSKAFWRGLRDGMRGNPPTS